MTSGKMITFLDRVFLGDIMVLVMQKNAFIFRRYLLKYLRIKGQKTEIYIEKF